MSCTVLSIPYALAWLIGSAVGGITAAADLYDKRNNAASSNNIESCDDVQVITEKHFIEKDFETPFTDSEILKKTLEEHGAGNIIEDENVINASVEGYQLCFTKPAQDMPYNLRISCSEQNDAEEKVSDLNTEYALNVQEDAYLHILDKLKENNMQIEEEVVEDDNTIVLTINIE